ncbi:hypothetical protein [Streptomyces sp. NPDC046909]|uniref:helix-turn-helix domain-containing protein n=1 Tax=Streptomyces sp. NPDC046909 TaxID=3155617 RepID=UPI0033D41F9E
MALSANEWAAQIARQVGQGIAHYRLQARDVQGRKLTAQALADRCAALGLPMDRTVIAKLEKGTRQTITVGEVLVLARALQIPPVELLFPIGRQENTEVFPSEVVDTWSAVRWFTGETEMIPQSPYDNEAKRQDNEIVELFRRHDRLTDDWWTQRDRLATISATRSESLHRYRTEPDPGAVDDHMMRLATDRLHEIEDEMRALRREMTDRGLKPPALTSATSFLADLPSPSAPGFQVSSIPMEPLPSETTEPKAKKSPDHTEGDNE